MSIILGIFHWRVCACCALEAAFVAPCLALRVLADALCLGGTSESVRMLREMAIEEVGPGSPGLLYLGS